MNKKIPSILIIISIVIPISLRGINSPLIRKMIPPIDEILVINWMIKNSINEIGRIPEREHSRSSGKNGKRNMKNKTTFSFPLSLAR